MVANATSKTTVCSTDCLDKQKQQQMQSFVFLCDKASKWSSLLTRTHDATMRSPTPGPFTATSPTATILNQHPDRLSLQINFTDEKLLEQTCRLLVSCLSRLGCNGTWRPWPGIWRCNDGIVETSRAQSTGRLPSSGRINHSRVKPEIGYSVAVWGFISTFQSSQYGCTYSIEHGRDSNLKTVVSRWLWTRCPSSESCSSQMNHTI